MGAPKPQATNAPFANNSNQQENTTATTNNSSVGTVDTSTTANTQGDQYQETLGGQMGSTRNQYGLISLAGTPEGQRLMGLDLGVDPGVARRTDLADQAAQNRWNSSFNAGVPSWITQRNQASERRAIAGQGAAEAQQARYAKNQAEVARAAMLLPNVVQTGQDTMGGQFGSQYGRNQQTQSGRTLGTTTETGMSNTAATSNATGQSSGFGTQVTQPGSSGALGAGIGAAGSVAAAAIIA